MRHSLTRRAVGTALLLFATAAGAASAHPADRNGRIAFESNPPGAAQDILSVEPDGDSPRNLTRLAPGLGAEGAAWEPSGEQLYFDSDLAGSVHVFAVRANGTGRTQVTFGNDLEFAPRISADGRLIAIERDAADLTSGGVFVANRSRFGLGTLRRLTTSPAVAMGGFDTPGDFSPDGTKLAFLRVLNTTPGSATSAVFVIGLDGRGLRQLTPHSLNAGPPRWSPDGSRLLFSSNWDNFSTATPATLYTVRPDGSRLASLKRERAGTQEFTPDWAPDGQRIVYAYVGPGMDHTEIHVRDLHSGHVSVAWRGHPGDHVQNPDWGPRAR